MQRRHVVQCLAFSLVLFTLSACDQGPRFNTTDVTGAAYGPALRMHDHTGHVRSLADFRGKVVVLFFGYTNCPDVCPTSLAMLQEVMSLLGADADRVQVLFVTLDPRRDTAERLAMYMNAFNPRFLGLIGNEGELAAVVREFKVFYELKGDIASGRYSLDHTAGAYLFDTQGRPRLFARHGETAARVAADIKLLLIGK